MRILFIGDVIGRVGRKCLEVHVPRLRAEWLIDLAVANGENVAGGLGATSATLKEVLDSGVDAITLGNHTWRQRELADSLDRMPEVVRPANYPEGSPGRGAAVIPVGGGSAVGLVNLLGRVYMDPLECPFVVGRREVDRLRRETVVVLVDMHAEASSEKMAMGWYLDGRCSAVLGTHTHVQTADERVLPGGTAYITDVGMTGPSDSVIGVEKDRVIQRFLTGRPVEFRVAKGRPGINAVVVEVDEASGRASMITRIAKYDEDR